MNEILQVTLMHQTGQSSLYGDIFLKDYVFMGGSGYQSGMYGGHKLLIKGALH